jgi:molecular chaperone GrpE
MSDKKKQNTEQTGKMNTAAETGAAEDIAEDVNAAPENGNGAEDSGQAEENTEAATDAKCAGAEAEESADVKYLRLAADFQNYKRRMEKERFERYSEGKKDFASELLPVLDNFERAIAQDAEDAGKQFHEGMEMILTQLQDVLK